MSVSSPASAAAAGRCQTGKTREVVAEQEFRRVEFLLGHSGHGGEDLRRGPEVDVESRVFQRELDHAPDHVVRATGNPEYPRIVPVQDGPRGLVRPLTKVFGIGDHRERGALVQIRETDPSVCRVAPNGVEGHAASVDAPPVDHHRFELAGHARLEHLLLHWRRNADTVVNQGERAQVAFSAVREEDAVGMSIPGVPQQFDDDVLDGPDVVLRLSALGLRDLESNVAIAEVLLDLEEAVARDRRDEAE